ncbi:hypothetical protein [Mycoplasma yeatsii]|uniref:hypothetical protein n=1 Tax=Mycoplasma yeatsii TaxID=51365 RepID=UPI000569199F|nr:hypothetical protein [Mycoplasma yeatsii]
MIVKSESDGILSWIALILLHLDYVILLFYSGRFIHQNLSEKILSNYTVLAYILTVILSLTTTYLYFLLNTLIFRKIPILHLIMNALISFVMAIVVLLFIINISSGVVSNNLNWSQYLDYLYDVFRITKINWLNKTLLWTFYLIGLGALTAFITLMRKSSF